MGIGASMSAAGVLAALPIVGSPYSCSDTCDVTDQLDQRG
jgi:hypothetical protein